MRHGMAKALALTLAVVLPPLLGAQPPSQQVVWTRISLTELHCNGCVKKLANQVNQVPGVAGVQGDLPKVTIYVQHKPGMTPSPRALWEAVEKGDHKPTLLQGPSGTFTAKPQL